MNLFSTRLYKTVASLVVGFAMVSISLVSAQPAFAFNGVTLPVEVARPGQTNEVAFTTTITLSDFQTGTRWAKVNIVHTSFTNPETTAIPITVTDTGFTQCGSSGIGIKISTGTVVGTCVTTTSGEYVNEIKFTPDVPSQVGVSIFFEFGPDSVFFVANNPMSLQPLTAWEISISQQDGFGTNSNGTAPLIAAPASGGTITFDANGGSGTMDPFTSSVPANIPLNTLTREGYHFDEWTTERDGTGTAYANGAEFPFDGDQTLYAQWAEGADPEIASTGMNSRAQLIAGMVSLSLVALGLLALAAARRRSWNR